MATTRFNADYWQCNLNYKAVQKVHDQQRKILQGNKFCNINILRIDTLYHYQKDITGNERFPAGTHGRFQVIHVHPGLQESTEY